MTKVGNSHAIIIDKAIMEAVGIKSDTPLQVTVKGNSLVIAPANVGLGSDLEEIRYAGRVKSILSELRPHYSEMLKNLADAQLMDIIFYLIPRNHRVSCPSLVRSPFNPHT